MTHTYIWKEKTSEKTFLLSDYGSYAVERKGPALFGLVGAEATYQYQLNSKKSYNYRKRKDDDVLVRPSKILVITLKEKDRNNWDGIFKELNLSLIESKYRYSEPYPEIYYSPIIIYPKK